MSSPPEWGPEAVDTAPVTTSSAQAPTPTSAVAWSQRGPAGAASPRSWLNASTATTAAPATTARARRKWDITAMGCRSSSTVKPPSGIWASAPATVNSATLRTQPGNPGPDALQAR